MRKGRINPFVSRWSVSFEFGFCRGKTRFTHVIAANCKRANSHNFKIKNLNFNGLGQHFQDLGHSFSPYGPPSRQITSMFLAPIRLQHQGMYLAPIISQHLDILHRSQRLGYISRTESYLNFFANDVMESSGCAQRMTLTINFGLILTSVFLLCHDTNYLILQS